MFIYTIVFIIGLIILLQLFLLQQESHIFPYKNEETPELYHISYENVSFTTTDKIMLKGWFIPQKKPTASTIILCHGLGTGKANLLDIALFLHNDNRHNLLLFDFRGHRDSQKTLCSFGLKEQKDLEAAINFLKTKKKDKAEKIGTLGVSMGGAVALTVSQRSKEIIATVSDSAYKSLTSALYHHVKIFYHLPKIPFGYLMILSYAIYFRLNPFLFSPLNSVKKLSPEKKLLIIHGRQDLRIPVEDAYAIHENASCDKELLIAQTADHVSAYSELKEKYEKKILEFFKKHLT